MAAILLACFLATPVPALAQCGDIPPRSSCITCHEADAPLSTQDIWHGIHARKDCCASCHGGNCSTMTLSLAHEGIMSNPLDDIYTSCHSCHPEDYEERAAVFALLLGTTPRSRATPTPLPVSTPVEYPMVIPSAAALPVKTIPPWSYLLGSLLLILIMGLLFRLAYCHLSHSGLNQVR